VQKNFAAEKQFRNNGGIAKLPAFAPFKFRSQYAQVSVPGVYDKFQGMFRGLNKDFIRGR
jgi:hypothetical protein